MCSTVQEQITTCGQNAIVKIGERTNIRPQKHNLLKIWRKYGMPTINLLWYLNGMLVIVDKLHLK